MASTSMGWGYENYITWDIWGGPYVNTYNGMRFDAKNLRWIYDYYIVGATKPSEEQFQRHYDDTKLLFTREGYSEREVKWWFLRTGQGPECFKQMQIGVPCGLPPYEVWRDWYLKFNAEGTSYNSHIVSVTGEPMGNAYDAAWPMYPPPGYSMPGMPCNTEGKRLVGVASSDPNNLYNQVLGWIMGSYHTWPMTDLPPIMGDPARYPFTRDGFNPIDMLGIGPGVSFCSDEAIAESANVLHPVLTCYAVFLPSSLRG